MEKVDRTVNSIITTGQKYGADLLHQSGMVENVPTMGLQDHVNLVNYVRSYGKQNVLGARVRINFTWNLALAHQLATSSSDREVVEYLTFGWPLNHDGRCMSITLQNHVSALEFPQQVTNYVTAELQKGVLIGPMATLPWQEHVAVSPMSTRPKRDSNKCRIIMDLSWPRDGTSVNDGIVHGATVTVTLSDD